MSTSVATAIWNEIQDGPLRWLAEGTAIALTEPGRAKDLFSKAAANLSGDLRDEANIRLASCYWAVGEKAEARAILESVKPGSVGCKFFRNTTMASMVTVPEALKCLEDVRPYFDQIQNLEWKGKFCNQLAVALRRSNDFDGAILAYTEAKYWFEEDSKPELTAAAANNLAELLTQVGQFEDAHRYVDEAIAEYERLNLEIYLGCALDTRARIYLGENNFSEAAVHAAQSVKLLERHERKEATARSLITEAVSLIGAGDLAKSLRQLDRAHEIAEYLGNSDLMFDVQWNVRDLSNKLHESSERSLVGIALKEKSIRAGAKKLRVSHEQLRKLSQKHDLKPPPYDPHRNFLRK